LRQVEVKLAETSQHHQVTGDVVLSIPLALVRAFRRVHCSPWPSKAGVTSVKEGYKNSATIN